MELRRDELSRPGERATRASAGTDDINAGVFLGDSFDVRAMAKDSFEFDRRLSAACGLAEPRAHSRGGTLE